MDDVAWDRCPDCLGLLDAVETAGGVALACVECGHVGAAVPFSGARPADLDDLPGIRGS